MDERLKEIHASIVHRLDQRLTTEDQLVKEFGLAKNTLRKFIKDGADGAYGARTKKQLLSTANQPIEEIREECYKWMRDKISSSMQEQDQLAANIGNHYIVYKLFSTGQQILVTHLSTEKTDGKVYFTDRSYIRNPFEEDSNYSEFEHHGFVFFRKDIIYFISFASSNLRLISIDSRGLTRYGTSAGLISGTDSDMKPYATRVLIKKSSRVEADNLKGQFHISDARLDSIRKYIENSLGDDGTLKSLSSLI